jgi:tRNA pseudouridine55 synthase
MDGALIVDKPKGITSHDAVATARRLLREKRIGHAGTLDPLATGVLVLLCGRATRLSRFIMASDKTYEARLRFGVTTDTRDITGTVTSESSSAPPPMADVERALSSLRGSYLQEPPAFSAKKVQGQRAYALARRQEAVELQAVPVTVSRLDVTAFQGPHLTVVLTCSAGFYVRSFAHALGQLVGTGACLEDLRRTRSGDFALDDAVSLADDASAGDLANRLMPMDHLLRSLPARVVTAEGRKRVAHGRELTPAQVVGPVKSGPQSRGSTEETSNSGDWVRLMDSEGRLIALGRTTGATLHPSVVLI